MLITILYFTLWLSNTLTDEVGEGLEILFFTLEYLVFVLYWHELTIYFADAHDEIGIIESILFQNSGNKVYTDRSKCFFLIFTYKYILGATKNSTYYSN